MFKMRGNQEMRQIALQISIALAAGIFSFIPSVSAAPVLNAGSNTKTTANVSVTSATDAENFPNVAITDVTATQRNNVVDWQDFSIAKDEMVRFDGGETSGENVHNYLNLVSGENTSRIDGAIKGGNNVYIVNPNGVIFGNSASVDVGSLYVSSRPLSDVDIANIADNNTNNVDMSPLANAVSSSGNAASIVNMGDVRATSVSVEGGNIILADVNRIKTTNGSAVNTNVTIQNIGATTGITLGHSVRDVVEADNANTLMNATGGDYNYTGGNYSSAKKIVSIRDEYELENVAAAGLGRNYLLIDDIELTAAHTPIGGNTADTAFKGTFDGQFHTISNVNVTGVEYGGLFGRIIGGTVKNVGVQGGSIKAVNAGGIAGKVESSTKLINVFNNGTTINMKTPGSETNNAGGIVGYAQNSKISSAYNTGSVVENDFRSGGIAGTAYTAEIENVYNTGSTKNGLVGRGSNGSITNAYASQSRLHSSMYTATKNNILKKEELTSTSAAYYAGLGFAISNKGGDNPDTVPWRIYEGQSLPLLRSFLAANGTVTVNYNYTHGNESGSNGGADLTANDLTYNGSYVTVIGTPSYSGVSNIDTSKISYSGTAPNGVKNVATKALFHTGQQGYDLIGNNVTMAKKQLSLSGSSMGITKVYDKSADAKSAVTKVLSTATNISGVVSGDSVSLNPAGITATYVDANSNPDATVGTHKITLTGTVNLTGTDAGNYTLEATNLSTLVNVTGTITQRPIYLKTDLTSVDFNKTYDGTANISPRNGSAVPVREILKLEDTSVEVGDPGPDSVGHGKIEGDNVALAFGTDATTVPRYVDVDTSGNMTSAGAANAGKHSVLFSGITLTGTADGDDSGNYVLCYDGTTNPVTNSQVLLKSGVDVNTTGDNAVSAVIRPRLLATDGFQVKTPTGQTDSAGNPIYTTAAANKTYDGTSTYTVPSGSKLIANTAGANSNSGLLPADSVNLWFDLSSSAGSTNFVYRDSNNQLQPTKMAAGAQAATGVAYAVVANTNTGYGYLKGNYTFDEATAASNDNDVTPWQTLNDANAIPIVSGAGTISRRNILIDTGNVTRINKRYDGNANVVGDDYTTIGGDYLKYATDSPATLLKDDSTINEDVAGNDNVAWSVTAAYDNKNVVRGADGVSVPDNAKNVNFTVALTGSDAVNYVLNGTNAETSSVPLTGTGKITPRELAPSFVDISKTYNGTTAVNDGDFSAVSGSITLPTITAGDDVQLVYDPNAAYYYNTTTGQAESNAGTWAVRYPNLSLSGNDSVNYNLSTIIGSGNGIINRRLILSDGFQVKIGDTVANGTKVYDGTSVYNVPDGATLVANTTASGNTGVIDADQGKLRFSLSNTVDSNFINTQNANTPTAKVLEADGIAYQVQADTADGYGYLLNNYKIGTTTSSTPLAADTTYAVTGAGNITRRAITIDISGATGIDKEYNRDTNLVGAGDINIGGAYLNYASGSVEKSKLLADDSTATAAAKDGDNAAWSVTAAYDNKNVVRDSAGNVVDNGKTVNFYISITGTDAANYTINNGVNVVNAETTAATPLTLTGSGKITPKEITATFSPVTKIYTGTTRINDRDSTVTGNGTVAGLTGDAVTLNPYNYDAAYYDTPEVGTNKTVYYPGLSLGGADSGNYKLSSTTGSSTGNSITPATVTLGNFVFNFDGVNRVYNGDTAVADSTQDITADQFITDSYIDLGAGAKYDFRSYIRNLNANYASKDVNANTGEGNVTYTFNLNDITIPNISITGDYRNYFATENGAITKPVGTITPKTVYATINNPVVTKTYNGLKNVQNYTAPLVSYSGLVGNSADVSTAEYLDKNQGTNKLVQYNVAISDGSNYSIQYNSADRNMANYTTTADGPAVTDGTVISTVVTPNNIINPKDLPVTFTNVTKQYDGTTDVLPTQVALGAATTGAVESGDTISLTGWNAAYNSPDVATANTVYYRNITLSGNENGNYNFVDANGDTLTSSTVINGNGTITPYALSGTYAFTLGDVTKEYDRTNAIKYTDTAGGTTYYRDGSEAAIRNFITAPDVTVNGSSQQMAYALDMNNTGYNDSTVGTHPATFRVGLSSSNYTFDNVTVTDGTNTITPTVINGVYYYDLVKNDATISPRNVYVALNNTPAITKTYDGTTAVEQIVTGKNNKVYMPDAADFLSGDDVDVDWNNISAAYSSENVAYDGDGNVTSQDVIYTVGLTGTDAGNYVLYRSADNTAITDNNKLTGTGIITPRELTVDFARDEHPFDNSAYLSNPGSNLRLGNLATRDAGFDLDNIAKAAIGGRYTDKNVNRADDGTVLDKGLTYNNLQNALSGYATRNAIAKNYTIADSVTYSVDDAKGVITPLEITDPLKAVWKVDVNKVYDATTNLPTDLPAETNANNILTLQVNTTYDGVLNLQGGSAGYQYSSAGYESKNQGDRALKYTLTGVNANQGNYQLSDAVVSAAVSNPWLSTDTTRNVNGASVTGNISARQLNIIAETDSKIYDGGLSVANPKALIHFSAADQAVITADADGVDYAVTANYTDKNAGTQDIAYTLTLNGNANGNYVLNSNTATITGDTATGTTTGDIAKRKVYVTPININNINKEYDTTNALPDTFTNADHFQLTPADVNTGIVAGDEDIQLNVNAIEGAYADEHAGNKTITFNSFALMDTSDAADSGILNNYTLETDSIVGSGTISPKALTIGIKAAPIKGYDTGKALSAGYATTDNLTLSGAFDNDAVNLQVNSANYSNAKAGTGKTYSYEVSIDNTDYKLTQGANLPAITVSNDGQTGVITANDGTITKRKVYVSLADTPDMVKTYDGNTGVKQDVTDKIIVRSGDLLADGTELDRNAVVINARYDSKDAGERTVTYNTKLKGDAADNYEIHRLSNINDAAADVETSTLTGKGVINKAKLTLDPASISKTYNGTSVIGDGTNAGDESLTKDKLVFQGVNNESFTLTDAAFAKVIGQYGYGTGDANVSWVGDEVADKDVLYTGLSDALAVMNADAGTNTISKNYTIDQTAYFAAAQAKGKIRPITITQAATANWKPVIREYNGDTDLHEVYDYSVGTKGEQLGVKDILQLTVKDSAGNTLTVDYDATANYDDMNVGSRHNLNYQINAVNKKVADSSGNPNYVLDSSVMAALEGRNMDSSSANVYSVITPRTLTVAGVAAMNKEYDGTVDGVDNAQDRIALTNYIAKDKDNLGFTATAVYDNPNAGKSEDTDELQEHQVTYTLSLANPNYQLETDTLTGTGTISRKGLTIVATPAGVNMGEPLPKFTGTVEGLVPADSGLASSFTFDTLPDVNTSRVTGAQTRYPVYGWYRNSYEGGNFGLNYTYSQDPANETAFTVNYINTDMGNPDLKPTPTHDVYRQIAKDVTSGFGDNNAASLQYVDRNGKVLATETIGSGTIAAGETLAELTVQGTDLANIGIVGGDIVNLEGADAAGVANIEMQDKGAVVNLEVYSLNGEKTSADGNPAAEIVSTDSRNALGSIQIVDESGNVLEEIDQDKAEKQEKEGEIAIQSSDGQSENEIELTVESTGVNVA